MYQRQRSASAIDDSTSCSCYILQNLINIRRWTHTPANHTRVISLNTNLPDIFKGEHFLVEWTLTLKHHSRSYFSPTWAHLTWIALKCECEGAFRGYGQKNIQHRPLISGMNKIYCMGGSNHGSLIAVNHFNLRVTSYNKNEHGALISLKWVVFLWYVIILGL